MAKRVVNLNMKDVSVGGVIPEGEYIVTVDEVSVEESQQGNQYLKWVFKVIDGPQKNSKIYHNTSLLPQSLFNLKNLLIALGVPVPDKAFQLNLDECEGCNCGVTVTHETYDGKKRSRVTDVFPLDASDVEDAEDDGEEVDIEEMSLEELIEFAEENDIKLTAKQKKRKSAALAAIQDALGDDDEEEEEADEEAEDEDDTESEEEADDEEEDEEEPALEDMDLEALIEFAEENEIKLTAKQKKRKSAALAAIQEALDDTDEEEEDDDEEEADEVDVFTLNLSECRSFAKDNGISLAKMPVKDRKNLDKVREYIQEKLDEAI